MKQYEAPGDDIVRDVKLSKERKGELAAFLVEQHNQILADRAAYEEKWDIWRKQMDSRLEREDAGPSESQIDMGITAERCQQGRARLLNPVFQYDRVFSTKPRKATFYDAAMTAEAVLDYITDRVTLRKLCEEWTEQAQTYPVGVVKTPWVIEKTGVKRWVEVRIDEFDAAREAGIVAVQNNGRLFMEDDVEVITRRGAFPHVIPIEDFIVPLTAEDVETASLVTHRVWLDKSDVRCRVRGGVWPKKIDGEPILDVLGDPSAVREKKTKSDEDKDESSTKQYEIMETYLAYGVKDDDDDEKEIIVWWERDSGSIIRCVYNFYHSYPRPFVTWCYKDVIGSIYGKPATQILEPIHRAYSACVNQRLDAASKANEQMTFIRDEDSELKKIFKSNRAKGGIYFTNVDPKDGISQFAMSQPFTQLPELEEKLSMHADKRMGLSDYSFGVEQIDRPTATGQVQLIEEGKQPLYLLLESFRASLAKVAMHMLARYRQFYPAGLEIYNSLMAETGEETSFVQWPAEAFEESVIIETAVSSQNMSKNMRKQELVALLDRMPQLYEYMMKLSEAASQPSPMAPVAQNILRGFQAMVDMFLEEFEIPKQDDLNPDLEEAINVGQMFTQIIQQLQGAVQQLQGQLQQAQMAQMGPGAGGPGMPPPGPQGPPPGMAPPPGAMPPGQGPMPMAGGPPGQPSIGPNQQGGF